MNVNLGFLDISASRDKIVLNQGEVAGNIWMAKLEGK